MHKLHALIIIIVFLYLSFLNDEEHHVQILLNCRKDNVNDDISTDLNFSWDSRFTLYWQTIS